MDKRSMKRIGKDISLLGFGCMRLPLIDPEKTDIDYPRAEALIDRAITGGVNYFDTAYMYHGGMSEAFTGHALQKYPRDSFYLADKFPLLYFSSQKDAGSDLVDRIFNEQLERCRVSYFDFYLAHALSQEYYAKYRAANIYEYLLEKKKAGVIRHLGFSFHDTPEFLEKMLDEREWDFVQIQLNYIDWDACDAKRLYAILTERDIPVVVMEPVRGGALATLTEEAVAVLKKADPDASAASWAIRYAASLPNVMTVLSGMSTMEQVEDNLKTLSDFKPLTDEERATLAEAATIYRSAGTIPCTGCQYCMPCPAGVSIPRLFSIYNHFCTNKRWINFSNNYKALRDDERADKCIACNACVDACPQHIGIPENMALIAEFYAKKGKV